VKIRKRGRTDRVAQRQGSPRREAVQAADSSGCHATEKRLARGDKGSKRKRGEHGHERQGACHTRVGRNKKVGWSQQNP